VVQVTSPDGRKLVVLRSPFRVSCYNHASQHHSTIKPTSTVDLASVKFGAFTVWQLTYQSAYDMKFFIFLNKRTL
jgi:hypothetical protein